MARQGGRFRQQFLKTRVCRYHTWGSCWNGDACRFAHRTDELQSGPDLTKTSMCTEWMNGSCPLEARDCPYAHGTDELRCTDIFFKTGICKSFMAGTCRFGDSCRCAHGVHELRKITDIDVSQSTANLVAASTGRKHFGGSSSLSETSTGITESSSTGSHSWKDCWGADPETHFPKIRYVSFSKSADNRCSQV